MNSLINLQAESLVGLYDSTFTKKEAHKTGIALVENVLESGEVDKMQLMCNLVRLNTVVGAAVEKMKEHLPLEKTELMGVTFNPVQGGSTLNYEEDPIYKQMKKDLEARAELLKLAQKQETLDTYGNEVPVVSSKPRKSSINISF